MTNESGELVARGSRDLAARTRHLWVETAVILGLGVAIAVLVPIFFIRIYGIAMACVAPLFALAALRARSARLGLGHGCRPVVAVGWVRAPDGANYAVFPRGVDPSSVEPDAVLRLTLRTFTSRTVDAFLCGDTRPSLTRAAAILDESGEVVAVGRVRGRDRGLAIWARRHEPTPWYASAKAMNRPPSV